MLCDWTGLGPLLNAQLKTPAKWIRARFLLDWLAGEAKHSLHNATREKIHTNGIHNLIYNHWFNNYYFKIIISTLDTSLNFISSTPLPLPLLLIALDHFISYTHYQSLSTPTSACRRRRRVCHPHRDPWLHIACLQWNPSASSSILLLACFNLPSHGNNNTGLLKMQIHHHGLGGSDWLTQPVAVQFRFSALKSLWVSSASPLLSKSLGGRLLAAAASQELDTPWWVYFRADEGR